MQRETPFPSSESLGVERIVHFDSVGSTMDEAHRLAEGGAPGGTVVIADAQSAGRGRGGNTWDSQHRGLWMTLLERPQSSAMLEVLSLRVGLVIAKALEELDPDGAQFLLKWPNDVFKGRGKVAGILVEARWREQSLEWIAIGVGINLSVPDNVLSAALSANVSRSELLEHIVPAIRRAVVAQSALTESELAEWMRRDLAGGRMVVAPAVGIARGITASGALVVELRDGERVECRSGSLVFAE